MKKIMDLSEKSSSDWEVLEQEIEEAIVLIQNLRAKNRPLLEKNRKLEEEKKAFNRIKERMEKKIKELIEKLSAIKD